MKFTLGWLKAHLDTQAGIDDITAKLTALGLELEGVEDRAKALAPFIVGFVREAKQHPDADRLRVCMVDTGGEVVQVVCGAPNARAGIKGVFAPPGTVIPGTGLHLKAGVIRGQASNGMLCSAREMGLSDEHDGIIELPPEAPIGAPFAQILGFDDPVIDISITPNRADCLGVRGIARDLACGGLGTLKTRRVEPIRGRFKSPIGVQLDLPHDATGACPMFGGRMIRGLRNGQSPKWLRDRLTAVGLRPISALVDITNFFTLDNARPLHVYDARKIKGNISVRLASEGESFAALNGKSYTTAGGETLIADENGPLGFGGIIGGEDSGCTEATVDVFLECALFDPIRTAATGRRHQILSDARYRFERGVDPAGVVEGVDAATKMILELCGGEPSEMVVAGHAPAWRRTYRLRPKRLMALGGIDVPSARAIQVLTALGCDTRLMGDAVDVTPPSWRGDIQGEADLVEEVARIAGFDNIQPVPLPREGALPPLATTLGGRRARDARRALAGAGLVEAVTFSFMAKAHAVPFGHTRTELELENPISADLDVMRPSILPNLILAMKRNADRGFADGAIFEVGPTYQDDTPTGQSLVAAALRAGQTPRHWAAPARGYDALDAKADALTVLSAQGLSPDILQIAREAPAWYHPGRSGVLKLGPKTVLAEFGEIHPAILALFDIKGPVTACEVYLDRLPTPKAKGRARPLLKLSPFQPVERDFAFVVDAEVAAEALLRAVRGVDKGLAASIFDVYQGKGVPEGKKSLAITVRLQPTEKTLTEAEIDAIAAKIVAAVIQATGATLRA